MGAVRQLQKPMIPVLLGREAGITGGAYLRWQGTTPRLRRPSPEQRRRRDVGPACTSSCTCPTSHPRITSACSAVWARFYGRPKPPWDERIYRLLYRSRRRQAGSAGRGRRAFGFRRGQPVVTASSKATLASSADSTVAPSSCQRIARSMHSSSTGLTWRAS